MQLDASLKNVEKASKEWLSISKTWTTAYFYFFLHKYSKNCIKVN